MRNFEVITAHGRYDVEAEYFHSQSAHQNVQFFNQENQETDFFTGVLYVMEIAEDDEIVDAVIPILMKGSRKFMFQK